MDWQTIATAPFDRDLELAVIDIDGAHALVFPCRRVLHGWVKAETHSPLNVHPTHWRMWRGSVKDAPSAKSSYLDEARLVIKEYADDLRKIIQKFRRRNGRA
jgi:hypothetical protein